MGCEGAKAGGPSGAGGRRGGGGAAGGADLILSVDFTWVGYSDEKRRKTTENKEFRCS